MYGYEYQGLTTINLNHDAVTWYNFYLGFEGLNDMITMNNLETRSLWNLFKDRFLHILLHWKYNIFAE